MLGITQALGGDYTVYVNGNLLKLSGKDADAIGIENDCKTEQKIIYENKKNINEDDAWNVMQRNMF